MTIAQRIYSYDFEYGNIMKQFIKVPKVNNFIYKGNIVLLRIVIFHTKTKYVITQKKP